MGRKTPNNYESLNRMSRDLNLEIEIVACPIVREPDGLAMSSRNVYLNASERQAALVLYRTLREAERLIKAGERSVASLQTQLLKLIDQEPLASLDYLVVVDSESLIPMSSNCWGNLGGLGGKDR